MTMGKKPVARHACPTWVNTVDPPTSSGHPFEWLNRILVESGFDAFVQGLCAVVYAGRPGWGSLRPGRCFRLLFHRVFRGADVDAWDCVAGGGFTEFAVVSGPGSDRGGTGPLDAVAHAAADRRGDAPGGVRVTGAGGGRGSGSGGKTVGVDATTLEANAGMRGLEREALLYLSDPDGTDEGI